MSEQGFPLIRLNKYPQVVESCQNKPLTTIRNKTFSHCFCVSGYHDGRRTKSEPGTMLSSSSQDILIIFLKGEKSGSRTWQLLKMWYSKEKTWRSVFKTSFWCLQFSKNAVISFISKNYFSDPNFIIHNIQFSFFVVSGSLVFTRIITGWNSPFPSGHNQEYIAAARLASTITV